MAKYDLGGKDYWQNDDGSYEDEDGIFIFRTVGGRTIRIHENQSLSDAMKKSGKFESAKKKDEKEESLKKGDVFKNEMGTKVEIKDIDEKGQTIHKFTTSDGKTDYKTYDKKDVESMLKQNNYSKMSDQELKDELEHNRRMLGEMERRLSGRYTLTEEQRDKLENRAGHYEATKDDIRDELRRRKEMEPVQRENEYTNQKETSSETNKSNDIEKMVQKGNTYIPIRKGEDEEKVLKAYDKRNDSNNMEKIEEKRFNKKYNIEDFDTKRRQGLIDYTQNNREQIKEWQKDFDNDTVSQKVLSGKGLTLKEYYGVLGREPREGDIILAGGKKGEDVRVGKDGKLIPITDKDYDYVPKSSSNTAYKKAFAEYKKQHPNTKLTLSKFIDMSEGK